MSYKVISYNEYGYSQCVRNYEHQGEAFDYLERHKAKLVLQITIDHEFYRFFMNEDGRRWGLKYDNEMALEDSVFISQHERCFKSIIYKLQNKGNLSKKTHKWYKH